MTVFINDAPAPHGGQPVLTAGDAPETARAAMVMIHGRGASATDILALAADLAPSGCVYVAPQAVGNEWYPYRFLEPLERNEPGLSSGLATIATLLAQVAGAGFPPERTMLLGFSQGACLMLEYVARHARRYGGVVGLSGALIGPDDTPRDYAGSLAGTPVFLGCSDVDPHIPKARVEETAEVLRRLGGEVTLRLYPGMGHTVNRDELLFIRGMQAALCS